ncbi:Serine/threonine-protein kinase Sgk2 [Coemansia spiralis]|nr:Serine/threonine-protein kinase Sgk2 [Coemansia spiralis]
MDAANANIPTALRQFLARGAPAHPHDLHARDMPAGRPAHAPDAYGAYGNPSATSSATTLQATTRLASAKSTGNLKSGSSLGAWLTKHHLRPGAARPSAKPSLGTGGASDASLPRTHTAHSRTSITADHAVSAYITSVETREASGSGGPSELRMGSLRMGRRRFLVYRVLVTGHAGQWWVGRRYSEFHELCQALRRAFPQCAHLWGEFPTKRLLPGLSSSTDSVMQRRERLNAFLRALSQDSEAVAHDLTQQFLRSDPLDEDSIPLAERVAGERDAATRRDFGAIKPLIERQPTKRSASSGNVLVGLGNANAGAPWLAQLPNHPPPPVPARPATRARESMDRMASMPVLKSAGAAKLDFDFSAPLPARPAAHERPPAPSVSAGPAGTSNFIPRPSLPAPMLRKISDPLEYATAEKRPTVAAPQAMRKKYGFRRNVQYRSNRYETKNHIASSSQPQIPLPPPPDMDLDDGPAYHVGRPGRGGSVTWDSDYVIVEDSENMDLDLTLRGASVDSELDASTRSLQDPTRGRKLAVLRRAALKGIGRAPSSPLADSAVISGDHLHNAKRRHGAASEGARPSTDDEDHDDASGKGRSSNLSGQRKVCLDDFQLLSTIGKGSYGRVMLARYKDTGKVMAIKVISKSKLRGRPSEIRRVMSERKVLERTVRHPFLVGLQCAFQTQEQLFFCLDYVNGGELFFHLQRERRFGENRARFYAAEITSALAYLHGMDVVYRDLKPENCLLDAQGHVRIVDFGLAKEVGPVVWRTEGSALYSVEESGKTGTFCGTPEYLAPEVLLRQRYGKEVDWYCLGAVLYEMLTGLPPFYDQDNNTMYQRILSEDLRFPATLPPPAACNGMLHPGSGNVAGAAVGRYAQDFVFRLMERDPRNRVGHGMFGTENVKRHAFFHGIDWGKIYRQEYAPPFVPKVSSIFDLSNIDPEFRNEPIPESILTDGQVDIFAEAAEAERQAELDMHAQLLAFPSPVNSPVGHKAHTPISLRAHNGSRVAKLAGQNADVDSTINAFRGFSFVSPNVNGDDSD